MKVGGEVMCKFGSIPWFSGFCSIPVFRNGEKNSDF